MSLDNSQNKFQFVELFLERKFSLSYLTYARILRLYNQVSVSGPMNVSGLKDKMLKTFACVLKILLKDDSIRPIIESLNRKGDHNLNFNDIEVFLNKAVSEAFQHSTFSKPISSNLLEKILREVIEKF